METNITLNTSFSTDLISSSCEATGGMVTPDYYWTPNWYYPILTQYYPVYYVYYQSNENKHQQAFNIAKMLAEKGFIEIKKVKDFIELVEEIFKAI